MSVKCFPIRASVRNWSRGRLWAAVTLWLCASIPSLRIWAGGQSLRPRPPPCFHTGTGTHLRKDRGQGSPLKKKGRHDAGDRGHVRGEAAAEQTHLEDRVPPKQRRARWNLTSTCFEPWWHVHLRCKPTFDAVNFDLLYIQSIISSSAWCHYFSHHAMPKAATLRWKEQQHAALDFETKTNTATVWKWPGCRAQMTGLGYLPCIISTLWKRIEQTLAKQLSGWFSSETWRRKQLLMLNKAYRQNKVTSELIMCMCKCSVVFQLLCGKLRKYAGTGKTFVSMKKRDSSPTPCSY